MKLIEHNRLLSITYLAKLRRFSKVSILFPTHFLYSTQKLWALILWQCPSLPQALKSCIISAVFSKTTRQKTRHFLPFQYVNLHISTKLFSFLIDKYYFTTSNLIRIKLQTHKMMQNSILTNRFTHQKKQLNRLKLLNKNSFIIFRCLGS